MVYQTVKKTARKLEVLTHHNVPAVKAFDLLSSRARTVEELVVIEVMRESMEELMAASQAKRHSGSLARSAKMPSRALSC